MQARSARLRLLVLGAAAGVAAAALASPAAAQSVERAVEDLRENHVTFEEGALTNDDLAALDAAAADLQEPDAFFKVVVLGSDTEDGTVGEFAEDVLGGLGGEGRVLVYEPGDVGVASSVDPPGEIDGAEAAAGSAATASDSFADGVRAAAAALGVEQGAEPQPATGTGGGGRSGTLLLLLLGAGVILLVPLLLRSAGRRRKPTAAALGEGERRVREAVDRAGTLIIELSDRIEVPDVVDEARNAFREGSAGFVELQRELEAADTQEELEAVYPRILRVVWQLETARALVDGQPAPPEPKPEPLFPAAPASAQVPHYREHGSSPWLTDAAMDALVILGSRGFGLPPHRGPMPDDIFGDIFGGGGGWGGGFGFPGGGWGSGRGGMRPRTGRSRPRITIGGGRGMGRRGMGRRR